MARVYLDEVNDGDSLPGVYRVSKFSVFEDRNGSQFASFYVNDRYGELPVKMWDIGYKSSISDREEYEKGGIAFLNLRVKEYKGKLQGEATIIRKAEKSDEYQIKDLFPVAEEDPYRMYNELFEMADHFEWNDLKKVVQAALAGRKKELLTIPAGKRMHHAVIGGLLYHTIRMARTAKAIGSVYPEVNTDLLVAGAIIHDLGKIDEFIQEKNTGLVVGYTPEADLFSHNILGILYLKEICEQVKVDHEVFRLLGHMVESHHGLPERGSAVVPKFLEADILHHLDMMDSRIWIFDEEYGYLNPGETSPRRIESLGHGIYYPKYPNEAEEN